MSPHIDPQTPVHSVLSEIRRRYEEQKPSVAFEQLCVEVRTRAFRGQTRCPIEKDGTRVGDLTQGKRWSEADLRFVWRQNIEDAIACCITARAAVEKPLLTLLLEAMQYCRACDAITAELSRAAAARHAARVAGGKLRHAVNNPGRDEAARLLTLHRPASGWRDATAAARAIEDDLRRFIIDNRLSIATGEHLVKTITGWIKRVAAVRAAFNGHH